MRKGPPDHEPKHPAPEEPPRFGVLSGLVTGWAALACLASIVSLREGPWLVGAINLPVWSLVLLHQYRTYRRPRASDEDHDEAAA